MQIKGLNTTHDSLLGVFNSLHICMVKRSNFHHNAHAMDQYSVLLGSWLTPRLYRAWEELKRKLTMKTQPNILDDKYTRLHSTSGRKLNSIIFLNFKWTSAVMLGFSILHKWLVVHTSEDLLQNTSPIFLNSSSYTNWKYQPYF